MQEDIILEKHMNRKKNESDLSNINKRNYYVNKKIMENVSSALLSDKLTGNSGQDILLQSSSKSCESTEFSIA